MKNITVLWGYSEIKILRLPLGKGKVMNKEFKENEIVVCVLFVYSCTLPGIDCWYALIISALCTVIYTSKAIWSLKGLNLSKIKKVLLIVAQLVGCLILYAVWLLIWFRISDGLDFSGMG